MLPRGMVTPADSISREKKPSRAADMTYAMVFIDIKREETEKDMWFIRKRFLYTLFGA